MMTERMRQVFDAVQSLPPEEQDRIAAAIQVLLQQPSITSDAVRPEVMAAFEKVVANSSDVLEYLRDK